MWRINMSSNAMRQNLCYQLRRWRECSKQYLRIWHLTNTVKCAAFLLTAVSKKAFVVRGVPTENYKEAKSCQVKLKL